MIPITRRDIIAHQSVVPWPNLFQVEQDLLLCRAMSALFEDSFLQQQIAMRGGTLLHKVYLPPPARYSEDIELVVFGDRPEGHIRKALNRVLRNVLGIPKQSVLDNLKLAIRNTVKPSRVLRMTYELPSLAETGRTLQVIVEANVTERKPFQPVVKIPFEFSFQDSTMKTRINGYDIHEMLGTKMRALFQRRRGRDLFDLYWALKMAKPAIAPDKIINSFKHYLRLEQSAARQEEFVAILEGHLADRGFCSDMDPLLRAGITYDPQQAGEMVRTKLLELLPER
ncbi:MAG TPA: nucleotidyl transferase AbiEii/AbiGii toxin family protein [Verrucomicrobiae bacterium]|jgi:predicted nucleotidyltransferase component of viral defense system